MEENTLYKVETNSLREMKLMLESTRMSLVLYDLLNWRRAIYNGKNYGEGSVLYKGKTYTSNEWFHLEHGASEYDENHFLIEKPLYFYTEDDVLRKLDEYLDEISDFIYNYYE